ncbi:MAG TPA: DUF4234 domain-containing protein [Candidatus Dormibacteraeota bacterium]|jgi:hypothetical protein
MATTVVIGNSSYKRRNPLAVWIGLPLITLGIYHFVWWYKINNEARRFLDDPTIRPGVAVLALIPGSILIVPPFVSIWRTTGRIARMQERAGRPGEGATPLISLLLSFLFSLHVLYLQMELNQIWDAYLRGGPRPSGPPMPPPVASYGPPASPLRG